MKNKFQIAIPKPCHANWEMMTKNQKGKFCASCQKNVIDFTKASDSEILLTYNQNEKLCGRFSNFQINRKLITPKDRKSIWLIVAASIMTFLSIGNQEVKAQESIKIDLTDTKTISDSTAIKPRKGTKNFIGVVFDENKNPLPGTTIGIKNSKISTNANENGEFTIHAKKGDILIFSYVGYENVELKLKDNDTSLKIYLNNPDVLGEVIIVKYKGD
jgi:hypothetical protein